jgi:DsbC/DsbD-like thiol-disulfide interchange protein
MKRLRPLLLPWFATLAMAIGLLSPGPANAQSGMENVVGIDILDGGRTAQGTYLAAVRLTLSDGWKTYWRAPGDAGIPPQFDWRGSRNLGDVSIIWPTPTVFVQNGMQSIGYHHQLVLPVEITPATPGAPVHLRGQVEIGLCKDVCIPGTLTFDHEMDLTADRNPAIAAALAQRPYSSTEAKVQSATCRLSPIEGGLRIDAQITMPSAGGAEVAVIEPGDTRIWASEAKTTRKGNVLTASSDLIHVDGQSYALDRSAVRITVLGRDHAVDILGCTPG